jgi:hypothetical protein
MTRLAALAVLAVGAASVAYSGYVVLYGDDSRGLLLSTLGMGLIWISILIDREARSRQATGFPQSQPLVQRGVPAVITRIVGLLVLMLGGFLLVACMAHYFSNEPDSWLGLANSPMSLVIVWLGLVIDRDRLREEGRRRREREGLRETKGPGGK